MLDISLPFSSYPMEKKKIKISLTRDKQVSPVKLDLICASFYSAQLNSFPKCLFFKNKISPSFSYVGSKTIMDFKIHGKCHILLQVSVADNRTGYVLRAAGLLKLPSVQ